MLIPSLKEAKMRTNRNVCIDQYYIKEGQKKIGHNLTYHIKTYGCQMNEHDSENIKAILEDMGFKEEKIMCKSDLILLNTCAIRENAHNKAFGMLGRLKHLKQENRNVLIGLCGCMAQEEVVTNQILNKYKWIDFVFGTHNIHKLPDLLEKNIESKKLEMEVYSIEGNVIENVPVKRDSKYKAWVNIMYGCDKFCTYCIVPFTRGKQRSRHKDDILKEIKDLVVSGYKEVTLLGQNVNAYGKDLYTNYNMSNLLQEVADTKIERIRFVTSHPWDFTDDMIMTIKNNKNIMPYIHLPLQSGSNKILKLMGRKYTKEDYLNLFARLKKAIPNVTITTDIIIGFPGETVEDFDEKIEVVNYCKFDGAYTFIFSKREGTPAAKMDDNISLADKEQRLYKLNELINVYSRQSNDSYINKVVPVLIEGYSQKDKNKMMGYTDTNKLVNVETSKENIGKIINVKIISSKSWSLDGISTNL